MKKKYERLAVTAAKQAFTNRMEGQNKIDFF